MYSSLESNRLPNYGVRPPGHIITEHQQTEGQYNQKANSKVCLKRQRGGGYANKC